VIGRHVGERRVLRRIAHRAPPPDLDPSEKLHRRLGLDLHHHDQGLAALTVPQLVERRRIEVGAPRRGMVGARDGSEQRRGARARAASQVDRYGRIGVGKRVQTDVIDHRPGGQVDADVELRQCIERPNLPRLPDVLKTILDEVGVNETAEIVVTE
jgi:hypothetical protein